MHGILNDPYINAEVTRLLSNVVQSDQVRSSSILLVNNLLAAERKHSNIISSYFSVLENPPLMQRSTGRQNFAGSVLGPRLNRTVRYQPVLGRGSLGSSNDLQDPNHYWSFFLIISVLFCSRRWFLLRWK